MIKKHIVKAYSNELITLNKKVINMSKSSLNNLKKSIKYMIEKNTKNAKKLIQEDILIDQMEKEIENFSVKLLALRKPVAQDLRKVIACLKISSDIERLGDYASNICKYTISMSKTKQIPCVKIILTILKTIEKMFKKTMKAFIRSDSTSAINTWYQDEKIDEMYIKLLNNLLKCMIKDTKKIGTCTSLLFVTKQLERSGDHVANICEMIFYIEYGKPFMCNRTSHIKGKQN